MIEVLKIIISWLSIISVFIIPLYLIIRILITLFPVLLNYALEDKNFTWYKGMNKHKALIVIFLSILSFFIAWLLKKELPIQFNRSYVLILFASSLAQAYILMLVERKLGLSLKKTSQLLKSIFSSEPSFYPEELLDSSKKNTEQHTEPIKNQLLFQVINVKKVNSFHNTSVYQKENTHKQNTKASQPSKSKRNELPFEIKELENEGARDFQYIQEQFGIHKDSEADVAGLLKGQLPTKQIIFTECHAGYIVKERVVKFFLTYFELYDKKSKRWKLSIKDIRKFQKEHTTFCTDNRDWKELNGPIDIDSTKWSSYRKTMSK